MKPDEFKAWLDGFLDGKDALDAAQIERIKEQAAKLAGPLAGLTFPSGVRSGDISIHHPDFPNKSSAVK